MLNISLTAQTRGVLVYLEVILLPRFYRSSWVLSLSHRWPPQFPSEMPSHLIHSPDTLNGFISWSSFLRHTSAFLASAAPFQNAQNAPSSLWGPCWALGPPIPTLTSKNAKPLLTGQPEGAGQITSTLLTKMLIQWPSPPREVPLPDFMNSDYGAEDVFVTWAGYLPVIYDCSLFFPWAELLAIKSYLRNVFSTLSSLIHILALRKHVPTAEPKSYLGTQQLLIECRRRQGVRMNWEFWRPGFLILSEAFLSLRLKFPHLENHQVGLDL